ncbi:unnamed protein product [Vicia faba]|uniref:Zinc finger MYM-type protein 1-like n=1 Tax=Vicia faba TaxID=3906 RepID=A0AAV0YYC5_VICFA|nr:unnamed protein product [Vicia faba]
MKDCPYAYYVHCFAHQLQLALVTASIEVKPIHKFFEKLTLIVNVVCSSAKRHDELQVSQLDEIEYLLEIGELVTSKGENQIGTLKRAGDTRWGSHFSSISSLITMYEATYNVSRKFSKEGLSYVSHGDADSAYNYLKSFDFIFILHLMKEIMGITNMLCQDLRFGRSRLDENQVTIEHYFRVEIFFTTIDKQLQELNNKFSEQAIDLLTLSCALSPKDNYKAFNIDTIRTLVEKYHPMDFNEKKKINLKFQLRHFIIGARQASSLNNLSTIQELCSSLVASEKKEIYYLFDRLFRLIMTLPHDMGNIEKEIITNIDSETIIIDDFKLLKNYRILL